MQVPQHIIDHMKELNDRAAGFGGHVYLVGGAVRDLMLGKTPKDFDFVTNMDPDRVEGMGYEKVGKAFPVFHTGVGELACTRTERKTGVGYTGFETSYTPSFKEDCLRRDLTINAMLWHPDMGLVCPIERSAHDMANLLLHACSEAFAEDPVRVLRVARFASSGNWTVTHETYKLMAVASKELYAVPADRIRGELEKAKNLRTFMWVLNQNIEVARAIKEWLPIGPFFVEGRDYSWNMYMVEFFCAIPKSIRAQALKKLGYSDSYNNACSLFDMITRWKKEGPEADDLISISKGIKRGMPLDWLMVMPRDLTNLVVDLDFFIKQNIKEGMSGTQINFMISQAARSLIP